MGIIKRKRLFLDTEFTSLDKKSQLLSIALYESNEKYFYGEVTDYDKLAINSWVRENVISKFILESAPKNMEIKYEGAMTYSDLENKLKLWFTKYYSKTQVHICADNYTWDWLHFCELYQGARNLPANIHYMPIDLATLLYAKGYDMDAKRSELAREIQKGVILDAHSALSDARAAQIIFNHITK